MKSIDYLIVGQGIAGSLLAHRLIKAGKIVRIIDNGLQHGSSIVAAGLINPITGRNFVKSWKFETLLTEVVNLYTELEQVLGLKLIRDVRILRALFNSHDRNKWLTRSTLPEYAEYLSEIRNGNGDWDPVLRSGYPLAEIRNGKLVDLPLLLNTLRTTWLNAGILKHTNFIFRNLSRQNGHFSYDDFQVRQIVFCEGMGLKQNPFFQYLPVAGYIGEALKVKIPALQSECILKQKLFLIPVERDLYWFGPFNHPHNSEDQVPSVMGKKALVGALKAIIKPHFDVVEQLAGVRPTVEDRRPLLGAHPKFQHLYIFNGLGTKGASLAPYFSKVMTEHLIANKPIPKSVSIDRFRNLI